jgi:hypothetical protein
MTFGLSEGSSPARKQSESGLCNPNKKSLVPPGARKRSDGHQCASSPGQSHLLALPGPRWRLPGSRWARTQEVTEVSCDGFYLLQAGQRERGSRTEALEPLPQGAFEESARASPQAGSVYRIATERACGPRSGSCDEHIETAIQARRCAAGGVSCAGIAACQRMRGAAR